MAELEIHHEGHENDPLGKTVGVLAAILAVMLAVVTIESHRTHTAAIMHKSTANDDWGYYQANSIKLHNIELGEGLLSVLDAKGAADQKNAEQEKAAKSDETAESDERRALRYDFGEGLLEIGLVLTSLYFISRKKMFPVMGVLAGLSGIGIAITGLLV